MTSYEWECKWIDDHPEYYEGHYHQEAVKRLIAIRYENSRLIKGNVTYTDKGTVYKYLGQSIGAGWRNGERLFVYVDQTNGQLFHRERDDFNNRMKLG